ncbi:MAG: ABC transporter permease [Chitinispirillaceae bacterium]|nr:ABC transporter permease [Chitinispirillaceae bacterium]
MKTAMGSMELFIAVRYLRGKRKIGFISWITYITAMGVCLGSFVLIVALAIANGFEKEVRDRIVGTLAHAKITQYHGNSIECYDSLRQVILGHPEVVAAAPFITGKGGVERDQVQEGVMFIGINDSLEPEVTDLNTKVKWGRFSLDSTVSDRERKFPGILIGKGLADKMGIRDGAEIVLMSLAPVEGEIDPVPKMARFTVSGVFETGMYEYDLTLVYISIESAQFLLNMRGVEGIQIKTTDLFNADKIAESVRNLLGGYPYRAIDWQMQNRSLFQWMRLERLIIFIVISLIVVVAAFNIISSLIMMILEKRREIGILMSMGATSSAIMRIFMANGIVIGFIGSTVGVALAVALCLAQYKWRFIPIPGDLYFINTLPVIVRAIDVVAVYITVNLICWLVTLYPAWKASQLLPAESIRYE